MTHSTLRHTAIGRISGVLAATSLLASTLSVSAAEEARLHAVRAALPSGSIDHVLVIDLENEGYNVTFGPNSPAAYLNGTLLKQGELVPNYFGTSHVSLGNYVSQVSGQSPTPSTAVRFNRVGQPGMPWAARAAEVFGVSTI